MLSLLVVSCQSTKSLAPAKIDPALLADCPMPVPPPKTRTETEDAALVNGQRLKECGQQVVGIREALALRDDIQYGVADHP